MTSGQWWTVVVGLLLILVGAAMLFNFKGIRDRHLAGALKTGSRLRPAGHGRTAFAKVMQTVVFTCFLLLGLAMVICTFGR